MNHLYRTKDWQVDQCSRIQDWETNAQIYNLLTPSSQVHLTHLGHRGKAGTNTDAYFCRWTDMEQGIRLINVSIASSHRSQQALPNRSPNKGRKLQKQNSPNLYSQRSKHITVWNPELWWKWWCCSFLSSEEVPVSYSQIENKLST